MGNFSLDKYQAMKPLFVEALDASRTVDILNHAQQQAALSANIKKTPAVVGADTYNRDAVHNQYGRIINEAADAEGNPLDKQSYVTKLATDYVNNPLLEAYGKSDAQKNEYDSTLVDRVKKADIKADDADLASQASLHYHNATGGTDINRGKYFSDVTYSVPNVVDEQGIVKDIVATPDGYRTENQSIIKYDAATGEIFSRSVVNGKEYFNQGRQVGEYLYANNEKGIRDRHLWDAKKEVAYQLVRDGKYRSPAEAFVAVDQNTNGDFTKRLNERVNEKKARFIDSLVAQKDFLQQERSSKQSINPAAVGGSSAANEPTELVIDSIPDPNTTALSDDALNAIDVDKLLAEQAAIRKETMYGGKTATVGGTWNLGLFEKDNTNKIKIDNTLEQIKSGNAEVLKKYGFNPEQWKQLPPEEQNNKIRALIRQRQNISANVGVLEKNNTDYYKTAFEHASDIQVYNHDTKTNVKVDRRQVTNDYLLKGLSKEDAIRFKENSGFKSNNTSDTIDSYEEWIQHAGSKTPVLALDFSGYKVKPYLQVNFGDNNSSVRVNTTNITESSLVPLQLAAQEFKNPTGREIKITPHIELSSGGNYKEYNDLTVKWINGTFTILEKGKPTALTLENLGFGMIGRQINTLNTSGNVAKTKANKPQPGK